jgi:ATP-dependent Clp protease ATP-binding subunit ClpA
LPEFLNRISSTVIFNRLTRREIRKIVDLRIGEVQSRLEANDRKVQIKVSEAAKDYLGNAGYSPAYGARPLSRLIEKEVLNKLAVMILRGNVRDGEVARVEYLDGKLVVVSNHADQDFESDDEMDDYDAVDEVMPDDMDIYD